MPPQAQLATKVELKRAIKSVERRTDVKLKKQNRQHVKLHDKIIENIQLFADHFDGKIDRVESSLSRRIEEIEHNLGNRISNVEVKLRETEVRLEDKIHASETRLEARLEAKIKEGDSSLEARLSKKIDEAVASVLDGIEAMLNAKTKSAK